MLKLLRRSHLVTGVSGSSLQTQLLRNELKPSAQQQNARLSSLHFPAASEWLRFFHRTGKRAFLPMPGALWQPCSILPSKGQFIKEYPFQGYFLPNHLVHFSHSAEYQTSVRLAKRKTKLIPDICLFTVQVPKGSAPSGCRWELSSREGELFINQDRFPELRRQLSISLRPSGLLTTRPRFTNTIRTVKRLPC